MPVTDRCALIGMPLGRTKSALIPRVLLIDEPSIGLSPKLVQEVMTPLRALADGGTTVLMVEQNVRTALKFPNRALVLEMGRVALDRPQGSRPQSAFPRRCRAARRNARRSTGSLTRYDADSQQRIIYHGAGPARR
jgi:energy-coupling factor transporter ATP-binding protein EcfA2